METNNFKIIHDKDPEFAKQIEEMVNYLASTYDDKYQQSEINTMPMILGKHGKGYNVGNAIKYLSRYHTDGFEKSNNTKDLLKAIHYCLFELVRRGKESGRIVPSNNITFNNTTGTTLLQNEVYLKDQINKATQKVVLKKKK